MNLRKVKWAIIATYNPPSASNETFQTLIIKSIDNLTSYYDNFIIVGDVNLTPTNPYLRTICTSLGLTNLIKVPTCFKLNCNPSSIDVILTNRKHHFKNSIAIETSLSDFHKLILTTLKSSLPKYHPEVKQYRDLRKFTEEAFCEDLLAAPFHLCEYLQDGNEALDRFHEIFSGIVDKHAPLKCKTVRANSKPLSKTHRKAIMLRTEFKNMYNKCINAKLMKTLKNFFCFRPHVFLMLTNILLTLHTGICPSIMVS